MNPPKNPPKADLHRTVATLPFDGRVYARVPATPIVRRSTAVTMKMLRFGPKALYMQQNGSETLDVVGRADQ